ncbi:sperm-associated antigen 8 isoform X2 [Dromiciops gliroides]|uniref:sperm-associated antigen 8 isoform X2 n=1 Tax=Dromiciops gliroides TaxID=33562 RepID=UPI001CC6406F|nr:sperm-associated antigen 8 isoform X2 [Dromiciops gliroides]
MPGKTEGGEAAEAVDGTGPEGGRGPGPGPVPRKGTSLTTPAAQDTAPDEAPAFTGEEPMVASQESSGTLQKGLEGSPDASFTSKPGLVCGGFLTQPRLPPLHCCYWAPSGQGPNSWEALQVPEPGAPGLPWSPDSRAPQEPLPRGQCLIHNWVEERATNELDRVLHHEESEGFRYRHGHVGLLTLELSSPHTSRTTQKDSYQHPGNPRKALRGRREAMLELLLHHQIRLTACRSSRRPTGYKKHQSFRASAISEHMTPHFERTVVSPHLFLCPWTSPYLMALRTTLDFERKMVGEKQTG